MEHEALAVVWSCEHFNLFVNGAKFKVITDHLLLIGIWRKANHRQLHLTCWALWLSIYDVEIEYQPGRNNPADYMSQHPTGSTAVKSVEEKMAEEYVRLMGSSATPVALTTHEIQLATSHDSTLQAVMELVRTGIWHHIDSFESAEGADYHALLTF